MSDRDLGSLGESEIARWADQRGIVPNRPLKDKKGWDLMLEFPHVKSTNKFQYSLDIRPPEISCKVQVKSTDKQVEKIKGIKLSSVHP